MRNYNKLNRSEQDSEPRWAKDERQGGLKKSYGELAEKFPLIQEDRTSI